MPFVRTSDERAYATLKDAKVPYEDIVELFARHPLSHEKIKQYLMLVNEDVYRVLAQNSSLSKLDVQFLWRTSFSCKYGRDIRLSLIGCQKLEPGMVEHILSDKFDYNRWSSLAQNPFLSEEQFDRLLFLTPKNFREPMNTLRNLRNASPNRKNCRE